MEKIANFVNHLLYNGKEQLIIDSFAAMYLDFKNKKQNKRDNIDFCLLVDFFKNLGVIPQFDKEGNIVYVKREEKKNFFKKKYSQKGERNLIGDILFNMEKELSDLLDLIEK